MNKLKEILESKMFKIIEYLISLSFLVYTVYGFVEYPESLIKNISCLAASLLAIVINFKREKIQTWLETKIKIALVNYHSAKEPKAS